MSECAIRKNIPLVYGSIWGIEGRLSFIQLPDTPCLRCVFPEEPPKEVFPVLGVTPGVIGSLQALEALKYLSGTGSNIKGKLPVWDGSRTEFRAFEARSDPHYPSCSSTT